MNRIETARSLRGVRAAAVAILSSALLLAASVASAGTITYTILPNPQADATNSANGGNTVDLSGTITISNPTGSPLGTFDSSNDSAITVSSDLTMTSTGPNSVPTVTQSGEAPLSSILGNGSVQFTSAGLFLVPTSTFGISNDPGTLLPSVVVTWNPANDEIYEGNADVITFNGFTSSFFATGVSNFVGGVWEIAAVPEPSTLMLLGSAIVGLAGMGLRRRRVLAT